MSLLYVITGPAGVGKSTISYRIANSKPKSVLIEGDDIYHQVVGGYSSAWTPKNHLSTFWKVCVNSIRAYLDDGYDVVFNYIVSFDDFEMLKKEFKEFKFVVLICDEASLIERDKLRPLDSQMGERCITLLNKFSNNGFYSKYYLDTSDLPVYTTVNLIENSNRFWAN